jgi:hypothetical protein
VNLAIATAARRRPRSELAAVLRDPVLLLWSLYVLLFPIYYLPSGLPQPSAVVIVLLAPLVFARFDGRIFPAARGPVRALGTFLLYVIAETLIWTLLESAYTLSARNGFLIVPIWYLFDFLVFMVTLLLYRTYRERFLKLTLWLVLISALTQAALSFPIAAARGGRTTLLFNNPNQLGFYALLSATLITFGRGRVRLDNKLVAAGLVACGYLGLLSASKGALLAIGLLVVVGVLSNPRMIVLAAASMLILLMVSNPVSEALDRTTSRFGRTDELGMLESRGYDRIMNHKEYWVLGAGEGDYQRFEDTTVIGDHELHSSGGTIFFCYGIVGSLVFLNFMWNIVRRAPFRRSLLLLPAFVYGLSHQGLRFTLLWVLLATFVNLKDIDVRQQGTS